MGRRRDRKGGGREGEKEREREKEREGERESRVDMHIDIFIISFRFYLLKTIDDLSLNLSLKPHGLMKISVFFV